MTTIHIGPSEVPTREAWRKVLTDGLLPLLSDAEFAALADGLERNDVDLIHGRTTDPPPLVEFVDRPCYGACLFSYGPWKARGLVTVGDVEQAFARLCFEVDLRLGEPCASRHLLNPWDGESLWHDQPQESVMKAMRPVVLAEVRAASRR